MSANQSPKFEIGQQVFAIVERQGSYRGRGAFGANVKSQKVMEVGSIEVFEEDDVLASGYVFREAGVYYHLRRPGGKGKGGQVLWAEKSLSLVE